MAALGATIGPELAAELVAMRARAALVQMVAVAAAAMALMAARGARVLGNGKALLDRAAAAEVRARAAPAPRVAFMAAAAAHQPLAPQLGLGQRGLW
jgi:hypothetical protein